MNISSNHLHLSSVIQFSPITRPGRTLPPQCGMTWGKAPDGHIHFCGEYGAHPFHICAICGQTR